MKKLVLASNGFENSEIGKEFLKLGDKPASEIKVLFIPTASRTKEELYWVGKSKEELLDLGIKKENIIDFNLDREISEEELEKIDVLYVCGGNTFYLLRKIRENKFDEKIKEMIDNGVVYVGVSAGSILAGPDIEIAGRDDGWDINDVGIKNLIGLNLTDKVLSPHYKSKDEGTISRFEKENGKSVLRLKDNQALFILDNKERLVE